MSYGLSHICEYKDSLGCDTRIELLDDGFEGAAEVVVAGEDPLEIEMNPLSSLFDPVVSKAAKMSFISTYSGQFLGLYTIDPKKRMVKVYKGSNEYASWLGYINTEVYGEDFSRSDGYEVAIYANDGFAALGQIPYLDIDDSILEQFATKWDVLKRVLEYMGLPFVFLYMACEHISEDVTTGVGETIFHKLIIDQKNYYDEQNEPMSCREVLEAILAGYPLQIRWHNGSLYIYDPSLLADDGFTALKYDGSFAYIGTTFIDRNLNVATEQVELTGEDHHQDIIAGYSKQVVRYSPYPFDTAANITDIKESDNWIGTALWTKDEGEGIKPYRLYGITGVTGWILGSGAQLKGVRADMQSDPDIFFQVPYYGLPAGPPYSEIVKNVITTNRYITGVAGQSVIFKAKVYARTKIDEFDEEEESKSVLALRFYIATEVGGKRPVYDRPTRTYNWVSGSSQVYAITATSAGSNMADKWVDVKYQLPWNFPGGELQLIVFGPVRAYNIYSSFDLEAEPVLTNSTVTEVRFKEFELQVIDVKDSLSGGREGYDYGPATFNDFEHIGRLNVKFKNEAPTIGLIHGDGVNITDRGAIRKPDYLYTTGWKKGPDVGFFPMTNILLRTIISQYRASLIQLSTALVSDELNGQTGVGGFFSTLQDTSHLGDRRMACIAGVYNDFHRELSGSFLEVRADDLSIVVE